MTANPSPEPLPPRTNRPRLPRAAASLRYRDYRLLWLSTFGNSASFWMELVVRSWIVWELTGSLVGVATINIVRMVPTMILAIPAGVLIDRANRKLLLLISQSTYLAGYLIVTALALMDLLQLWHLYIVFAVLGVAQTLRMPVRQSLIAMIVPNEEITSAVALNQAAFTGMRIVGPVLAGAIMDTAGVVVAFAMMSIAAAVPVVCTALLRVSATVSASFSTSPLADAVGGLAYVARTPLLRLLLGLSFTVGLLGMPFQTLLPAFADNVFNIGASGFGLLISASATGTFIATIVIASARFARPGTVVVLSLSFFALSLAAFANTPLLTPALAIMGVSGLCLGLFMTLSVGLLLSQSDPAYHGRLVSLTSLNQGFMPLGGIPVAALADIVGVQIAMSLLGVLLLVATVGLNVAQPQLLRSRIEPAPVLPPAPVPAGGSSPVS